MEIKSKYEKQILEDLRGIPVYQLPKFSKLIRFVKEELLSESKKPVITNKKSFVSLEGIFHGKIEHTEEEIRSVELRLKEV